MFISNQDASGKYHLEVTAYSGILSLITEGVIPRGLPRNL
jgi:hypothetical protein